MAGISAERTGELKRMCGFAGYLDSSGLMAGSRAGSCLPKMIAAIRHRGPDDAGYWEEDGLAMGHARLSIVDLSPAGHQPMTSEDQRFVLVFNGEIYNHHEIRQALEAEGIAPAWRGHSDTESLLAGLRAWGVKSTLQRCIGMFAFALWDRVERTLTLARDRLGEKPLYYGWQGREGQKAFLFGSELKALRVHPAFSSRVDRNALALYLRHNYIPAPHSIYEGIYKLQPGTLLTISATDPQPKVSTYWFALDVALNGSRHQLDLSPVEAVDQLEALLTSAVSQQMVADVPLGAFLSGGIDSSTIVAIMQANSGRRVKTFTIGFNEDGYNEAEHAKSIAAHLGTDHTELYVTSSEAMSVIPRLPSIYDEPFADSSQIPTFLISELARRHVTVSLSGDAGDELFSGYTRYTLGAGLWRKLNMIPFPLRRALARSIMAIPPGRWDSLRKWPPFSRFGGRLGDKLHKGAGVVFNSKSIDDLYLGLISHWAQPESIVIGGKETASGFLSGREKVGDMGAIERMMALDLVTYLPDDILTKVDRASMAVSLESRIPMLDHRVVEFAWSLPQSYKLRDGVGKWVLRQVLYRHVPKALIDRPKMGFGVPIDAWLRGPLREWAESLLDESRLDREGYFHSKVIVEKWREHQNGSRNWAYHLWDVLMFQAWLETQTS